MNIVFKVHLKGLQIENIYNYTKFTNVSRVKYAVILYTWQEIWLTLPQFTGSQERSTALATSLLSERCFPNDNRWNAARSCQKTFG